MVVGGGVEPRESDGLEGFTVTGMRMTREELELMQIASV